MPSSFRPCLLLLAILLAGCASRAPDPAATGNVLVPQGDVSADETPEPLTPGIKPLTVEQEETISQ